MHPSTSRLIISGLITSGSRHDCLLYLSISLCFISLSEQSGPPELLPTKGNPHGLGLHHFTGDRIVSVLYSALLHYVLAFHLTCFLLFRRIYPKAQTQIWVSLRISLSSCRLKADHQLLFETPDELISLLYYHPSVFSMNHSHSHQHLIVTPCESFLSACFVRRNKSFIRRCFSSHGSLIILLRGQLLESSCLSRRT